MASISELLDKVDQIKNENAGNDGLNRTRAGVASMIVGALVGVMIGYSKKWNLFYSAIGGGVAGGVIGTLFTPKK